MKISMRKLTLAVLLCSAAIPGLAACGFLPPSADAKKALAAMALDRSGVGIVTYEKLNASGSRAEFTDAKITVAEGLEIPVGKIVFTGLDMTAGDAGQPSFKSLELTDIAYALSGVPGTSAKLNIKRMYLLDPGPESAKWATGLFQKKGNNVFPDISTLKYKDWRIEGIEGSFKSKNEDASGMFRLTSVISSDLDNLTIGRSSMNGFSFEFDSSETGRVTMAVDEVEAVKPTLKLAKTILDDLVGTGSTPATPLVQGLAKLSTVNHRFLAQFGPLEPGHDRMTVKNISFSGLGIKGEWPSMTTTTVRDGEGFATGLRTEMAPLVLSPLETGRFSVAFNKFVEDLGYTTLALDYDGALSFDRAADRVKADKIEFNLANGAVLALGGSVSGVVAGAKAAAAAASEITPDAAAPDTIPSEGQTDEDREGLELLDALADRQRAERLLFEKLSLEQFDLTFADASLVDRIVQYVAKTSNKPAAAIREQALNGIKAIKSGPEDPAGMAKLAMEFHGALESFLRAAFERKPATFSIAMKPVGPLSVSTLQSGAFVATPEKLGLKFSSQQQAGQ